MVPKLRITVTAISIAAITASVRGTRQRCRKPITRRQHERQQHREHDRDQDVAREIKRCDDHRTHEQVVKAGRPPE